MQLVIHPDAQLEVIEAADWYEQRATGLGDDLVNEVQAALETIVGRPGIAPTWPGAEHVVPPIQWYSWRDFDTTASHTSTFKIASSSSL